MRIFDYVCTHQKFLNSVFAPKKHDFFEFLGKLKNDHSMPYTSKLQGSKSLSPLSGEKISFLMKLRAIKSVWHFFFFLFILKKFWSWFSCLQT